MKKLFLVAAIAVFGLTHVNAQEFKLGLNAALPVGDANNVSSFGVAAEAAYLFAAAENLEIGPSVGYTHFFGKDNIDDFSWLPISATARYGLSEQFGIGLNLGYAVGIAPSGIDGGFYYAPRVSYGLNEKIDLVLAYRGISVNSSNFSQLTLGVEFGL